MECLPNRYVVLFRHTHAIDEWVVSNQKILEAFVKLKMFPYSFYVIYRKYNV